MTSTILSNLTLPFTGILISLVAYMIGMWLSKKSNGFFLFNPLLVGMLLGIFTLMIWGKLTHMDTAAVYTKYYLPGGNLIFWFLNPATVAFAIPIYRVSKVFKKYWFDIIVICFVGGFISLALIQLVCKAFGLSTASTASMLPQAATTAVAMPIAAGVHGVPDGWYRLPAGYRGRGTGGHGGRGVLHRLEHICRLRKRKYQNSRWLTALPVCTRSVVRS